MVLLTSSLSGLEGATYVGIDNRVAGRSAGRLLSQWVGRTSGRVLLLTNSLLYCAHQQRVGGFLEVLHERAPNLVVNGPVECYDDDAQTARAVDNAFAEGNGLVALYNTGCGSIAYATPCWNMTSGPCGLPMKPVSSTLNCCAKVCCRWYSTKTRQARRKLPSNTCCMPTVTWMHLLR